MKVGRGYIREYIVGKLDMISRCTVNTYELVKEQTIDTKKKERQKDKEMGGTDRKTRQRQQGC